MIQREDHPFAPFLPPGATGLIVGSFPIPMFTVPQLRRNIGAGEIDFFYGGRKNQLWKLLGHCFGCQLTDLTSIKQLLNDRGLGVADIIRSCHRKHGSASDSNLSAVEYDRNLNAMLST